MNARQIIRVLAFAGFASLAWSRPALADLHIDLVPMDIAPPPAPELIVGGGDLHTIMRVAVQAWERVFRKGAGRWNVSIEYGWAPLGGIFARDEMLAQGGTPIRITHARVFFNNKPPPPYKPGVVGWFADPTPWNSSEYLRYTEYRRDVAGGQLNVGRVFSEATGDAEGRVDLLTVAMHEIGHALGLDYAYVGFQTQFREGLFFDVTPPRPLAGFEFIINYGPHIGGFDDTPLMVPDPYPGWRQLISGADLLLVAQASSFDGPIDVDDVGP